ncbi:MAG: aminotransferase class V-fold PLP-dependent enzyme [Thermosediminibacteraceae bacterium]|nr:aminotransferase class V-fold PLP-dependent enzyme [Thermosediminibacteraceae bacterium]
MEELVYLDNAATTYPKPAIVYEKMDYVNRHLCFNVGRGSYKGARQSADIVDETRKLVAELVKNEKPQYVVFSPSATIAFNIIVNGLEWDIYKNVFVSPFEHNAVLRPLHNIAQKNGARLFELPFDKESFEFDAEAAKRLFEEHKPDYVFITHVSNVTGYILPVKEIAELARKYGAIVILDVAQSLGLVEVDLMKLGVDIAVFAGHKNLYGPLGIGGFVINSRSNVDKVLKEAIFGGTGSDSLNLEMPGDLPGKFEAGSPNIVAIAGLNAALKWLKGNIEEIRSKKKKLTLELIDGLKSLDVKLYLPADLESHIGIVSINVEGFRPEEVSLVLDRRFNIATRAGYHCAAFVHRFLGTVESGGTLRISVGYFNEKRDIEYFIESLKSIVY